MTAEALQSQLLAITSALGAEGGSDHYYRGQIAGAPFLLKLISATPPTYLIKLRMIKPQNLPSSWPGTLPQGFAAAHVDCEIEDDYVFIWIRDASSLGAADVVALIRSCVEHHASLFPKSAGYCYDCGASGSASVVQSSTSISSICAQCLQKRSAARESEEARLNESTRTLTLLLPVVIALSALGWALFWWLYDAAFAVANTDRVFVPRIVVVAVVLGVGFGLGWPIGKLLHRSGLVKRFSPAALSIAVSVVALVLGEFLLCLYLVFRATGSFGPGLALRHSLAIAFGDNPMYALLKFGFAISFGAMVFKVAKPTKARLRL